MRRFIAGIAAMTAATVATALLIGQTSPSGEARPATPECEGVKFGLSDAEIAAMETRDLGNWIERAKECRAAMAGAGEGEAQAPASMAVAEANTAALAKCTEIASSVDRLACFDRAAKGEGLAGEVKVEHPRGRWRVSTDINKFTDREDVYASVDAKDEIRARSYRTSRPTLFIRCKDNTTSIIIAFGAYITTDTARLRLRIGDGKPVTANWRMSTNYESAGLWSGSAAIPFIKSLYGKQTLLVETTPHGESPVTAEFNIAGVEEAIAPVRKACGW